MIVLLSTISSPNVMITLHILIMALNLMSLLNFLHLYDV
ncbi:hypothetical protein ANH9381_0791 [Aggregatibacter actinomycetemcomitans ANH9381]|nr:hypothetical protein ANH9381_0791 [Aggregatibacter actinomycetemcomitans ANH9381]